MKIIIPIIAFSAVVFMFFCLLKFRIEEEELKIAVEEILNTPDLNFNLDKK